MTRDEVLDQLLDTLRGFEDQVITGRKPSMWGQSVAAIESLRIERDAFAAVLKRHLTDVIPNFWDGDTDHAVRRAAGLDDR